jgi:hypothetical protein
MSDGPLMTCITCNNSGVGDPRQWHAGYQHPFRGVGDTRRWNRPSEPASDEKPDVSMVTGPHDPVLRQALIDKGVLTPDDLRDAQAKILMVSGAFHSAVREAMQAEQDAIRRGVIGDDGTATTLGRS